MTKALFIFLFALVSGNAQTTNWLIVGSGINTTWSSGTRSIMITEGFATTLPINQKIFARLGIAVSEIDPLNNAKNFPMIQPICMMGYRVTKRVAVLSGFAETIQLPQSGLIYLPTFQISTAIRIKSHWGIFTPLSFNEKGYGLTLQLGYRF